MLENLEFAEISPIWGVYTEMFLKFVFDNNPRVRDGAFYGLNLLIQKSPL